MLLPSFLLFGFLYCLSFFLVLSSNDWILIWIGLEMNMMSFILLIYQHNSEFNIESCLKYFFIQSLGSALFLSMFYMSMSYFSYLGILIMSYKMGGGLFYFWFPSICMGIGWISCYFLMTFQKILPLLIMSMLMSWMIWVMILVSLIMGALGSMNQVLVKRLMAFSSIHHIGWLMVCMMMEKSMWMNYLVMYMLMLLPIMVVLSKMGANNIMEMNYWENKNNFIICVLSMGGMPPFLGFFLKWLVFYYLIQMNFIMLTFMILMSVLMFYIYIRIIYSLIMKMGESIGWEYKESGIYFYQYDLLNLGGIMSGVVVGILFLM